MTREDNRLLLSQAKKLVALGKTVERERKNLKRLVDSGVSYSDPRMLQAYQRFAQVDGEWKFLEAEHIRLREKLSKEDRA